MKYWINKDKVSENFVVLTQQSLVLGSCDEENIDASEASLKNGDKPEMVFGSDNFEVITLSQVFKVISRNTDADIDIHYTVKKDEESKFIDFTDIDTADSFLNELQLLLPEGLKKKEFQQSIVAAGFPAALSFLVALAATAMFINKFRWLAIIVGGLWGLFSLYRCYTRITNPPKIVQWSSKGAIGSAWSHIKTAASLGILALIVLAVSTRFPDNYGEDSFSQHMEQDELTADGVVDLLENGGDINSISRYGNRVLHYAVYHDDTELFKTLLENGADPSLLSSSDYDALDEVVYAEKLDMLAVLLGQNKAKVKLEGKLHEYVTSTLNPSILSSLFDYGADPSELNGEGFNVLQVAMANYADYELVSTLIENQVPVNVRLNGMSLQQYAIDNGQDDVAQLFDGRIISFDRERELTEKIDAFYAKALDAKIENASGITKLILNSEGLDDDRQEMAKELSKSMQYKSLAAWGNQQVTSKYAEVCELNGFEKSAQFSEATRKRGERIANHSDISALIIERNRSIYNEAKGEFVVPSDYQNRLTNALALIDKQFSSSSTDSSEELSNKCASVYARVVAAGETKP